MLRPNTRNDLNSLSLHEAWLQNQRDTWHKRAKDYSSLEWVGKQDFIHSFVGFGCPDKDWWVLDIGTGRGIVAAAVSPFVGEVIGRDSCEKMIA